MNLTERKTISSLEIAELTGKPHADLMKAIRKMEDAWTQVNQGKFSLITYTDSRNRQMPCYELTKTECLYIATKFNDVARAKLVLRWQELEVAAQTLSPAEQLLRIVELSVEQEKRMNEHDERLKLLEAKTTTRPDYFTIAGYATLYGEPVNLKMAAAYGREASRLCKSEGLPMGTVPDPRFGKVRTYPKTVLSRVFGF